MKKKNFILNNGTIERTASTMMGVYRIVGGSYKYIGKLLRGAEMYSEYRYRDWTIKVLREVPNRDRGIDIN